MKIIYGIITVLIILGVYSWDVKEKNAALNTLVDLHHNASIGVCIKDVETGKTIINYNANKLLRPASVLKLLTTITALDKLGSNYRYITSIGYDGNIKGEILDGSICIKASGDPVWGSKYFKSFNIIDTIVDNISNMGIKKITKGFVVDRAGIYEGIPGKWLWEDIGNYYGSPSYAINYRDNTYEIEFSSKEAGSQTVIKSVWPCSKELKICNKVISSEENRDNAWIYGSPLSDKRLIEGNIPQNRTAFTIKGAIPNPAHVFINELCAKLRKNGIDCNPELFFRTNQDYSKLLEIKSPPLKDIVYFTNQKSVNLFAESIGKRLMLNCDSIIDFSTVPTGFFKNYWAEKGININGLEIYDFSGLSSFNLVTSAFMTDILIYTYKNGNIGKNIYLSLPLAGNSGTLKNFGKGTMLDNNLKAKTGSMKSVRAYCGYIQKKNRLHCFTVIINNYSSDNKKITNSVVDFLNRY